MAVFLARPNSQQRTKFKSRVKDWVKLFLAQEELKSVWPTSVSPGFVTQLAQVLFDMEA